MKADLNSTAVMLAALFLVFSYIIVFDEGVRGAATGVSAAAVVSKSEIYINSKEYFVEETVGLGFKLIASSSSAHDLRVVPVNQSTRAYPLAEAESILKHDLAKKLERIFDALRLKDLLRTIKRVVDFLGNKIPKPSNFHIPFLPKWGDEKVENDLDNSTEVNDHMPIDIRRIGLSEIKLKMVGTTFSALQNKALIDMAAQTHVEINEHLIYRYFAAVDFAVKYNSKR